MKKDNLGTKLFIIKLTMHNQKLKLLLNLLNVREDQSLLWDIKKLMLFYQQVQACCVALRPNQQLWSYQDGQFT